jgi:hypothetical protein
MNWLTSQLSQLDYFSDLMGGSQEFAGRGLRRLPYSAVTTALVGRQVPVSANIPLDKYFLLAEDAESAAKRVQSAVPVNAELPLPKTFTLALDDGQGAVLYLPEDQEQPEDFQLFSSVGPRISRIRVTGNFQPTSAQLLFVVDDPELERCPDGPCANWGDECGPGCICTKFEVHGGSPLLSALSKHFTSGPGRTYVLRCVG